MSFNGAVTTELESWRILIRFQGVVAGRMAPGGGRILGTRSTPFLFSRFHFFLFRIFRIEWASHLLPICYNNEAGDVRVEIKALRPASETGVGDRRRGNAPWPVECERLGEAFTGEIRSL